ncbi:hypothetical protein A3H89_02420 [Candidatus Amesbacteria bacterium RIFCSPLOWO2_02_FULL_48_11]|uniref:Uncharacterized protein n=1 Tax=Candidatus Amesbacteria bacterium RIFOXYD1_FULL_47_9 TaxID=1797267 RepID=A0A1F5A0F3_9BACT|nr:MAG: hypothetical protein A3H89_02420 [Candidatus Amesbacteria bacterium RIFCSPLOWO2_02_FULL_48_11]OGD12075.1 MAG: hypothetical protein A2576_02655 [Candidatus Amesbacteria bacterium RIFOXYD1_FULL_47_9]
MAARQYKPFSYKWKSLPLIIYPVKDENPLLDIFDPQDNNSIQKHLVQLYSKHSKVLSKGNYHILFVWNLEGHRMTNVWIHDMTNWSDSGPLLECVTFRDIEVCDDAGIASGDSVIALGREEELRRKVGDLQKYVNRENYIPIFPKGMEPVEDFYKRNKSRP